MSDSSFWSQLVACHGDPQLLVAVITRHAAEVIGEASVLTVVSEDGRTLQPAAVFHEDPQVLELMRGVLAAGPYRVGEGIAGAVAATREPVVLGHLAPDSVDRLVAPHSAPFTREHPIKALMIVPLVVHGEVIGTLGVVRTASDEPYSRTDLQTLESLAERAALPLGENRRWPRRLGPADHEAIYQHSIDGVLFTSPDGMILAANPAACEILQLSEAAICQLGRAGLVVGDDPRSKTAIAQRRIAGHARAEIPMRRGNGGVFMADVSSTIFTTPELEVRAVVVFRDVSKQVAEREWLAEQARELGRAATRDDLTGLRNRRGFMIAAEHSIAFADREGAPVQLVFLDIDGLKDINDTLGHVAGDTTIRALGTAIADAVRDVDVAARLAGDEFVVLLYGATTEQAASVVERIVQDFAADPGTPRSATFSVGLAERRAGSGILLNALIHDADTRMYQHKAIRRLTRARDRNA